MPIQWLPPRSRPQEPRLEFLRVPPGRLIHFPQSLEQRATVILHVQPATGQSCPCMGDGICLLCPQPVKVHTYALVWHLVSAKGQWLAGILDLGYADSELACTELQGRSVFVAREKADCKRSNLVVRASHAGQPLPPLPTKLPIDDIKVPLMRRWGIDPTKEYFAPRDVADQPRLFTGGDVA
jgi:hypothetical protein